MGLLLLSVSIAQAAASVSESAPPPNAATYAAPDPEVDTPTSATTIPLGRPDETKAQRDARMAWWREARFGLFIHWGLYSVPAGIYENQYVDGYPAWIMYDAKIPVAEYAAYAAQFNPVKFDADAWVKLAEDAGTKYIVMTAKHHEGFAMFHSQVDPFNIYDATPFKRDPVAELAAACAKYGMKFGIYYSEAQDWHHPGGAFWNGEPWDPAQLGNMDDYLKNVALPQVTELLTHYGPIAYFWYDTPVGMTPARVAPFLALDRLQPNMIINDRLSADYQVGDTMTPEECVPDVGTLPGVDWETCMTINDSWGYDADDSDYKSAAFILESLIDVASKGGNFLLDVGPDAQGVIPAPEVKRLQAIGAWLKVNGAAIYGTGPTPFGAETTAWNWRCTTKPGMLYISIFTWPQGHFDLSGVKGKVTKAYLLADPERHALVFSQDGGKLTVKLPDQAPDAIASVLCLEVSNPT